MISNIIFVCVLKYPTFKHIVSRLVIRDDRDEMKGEVKRLVDINSVSFVVDCIAQYNFKAQATKYYTVEQFLES